MTAEILDISLLIACLANLGAVAFILAAIWSVNGFRRQRSAAGGFQPPVTILKPVCGLNVGLYDNLRSFCLQDYPEYQVVIGVRSPDDPAVPLVRKLIEDLPLVDISLVIDETVTGPNLKVSNLGNMYRAAKHAYLLIADSDMRVDSSYAATVVAPLADAQVGLVTCLYSATPAGGLPSLLASMFINEWFLPAVLVSTRLGEIRFGLGATMAVRRNVLESVGGFEALSHYLADDHMLGRLANERGFKVTLSRYVVENVVYESSLRDLFKHELRWARTIRAVAPLGHAFSFLMYGVPLALFGSLAIEATFDWDSVEFMIIAAAVLLRVAMHLTVCRRLGLANSLLSVMLVPVRDILSFFIWGFSFYSRRIDWNNMAFTIGPHGTMISAEGAEA